MYRAHRFIAFGWIAAFACWLGLACLSPATQVRTEAGHDATSEVNGLKAQLAEIKSTIAAKDVEINALKAQVTANVAIGPVTAPVSAAIDAAAVKVTTEQTNKAVETVQAQNARIEQQVENGIKPWQLFLLAGFHTLIAAIQTTISKIVDSKIARNVRQRLEDRMDRP